MSDFKRSIDHVIALLQEEINRLERIIDDLSEDSPVGSKFDLEQTCFQRLLEYALEEQKNINEIWRSKK